MSKVRIVMYHYVRNLKFSRYPNIKGLDYDLFKEQIEWMVKNYNFIKIEDIIGAYESGDNLPENAMLLTFDDGYIDNFTYCFPVLDKYKIQGVFYIPGKTFTERKLLDVNKIHFLLASTQENELMKDLIQYIDKYRSEFNLEDNTSLFKKYAKPSRWDKAEVIFIKRMLQTALPEELRSIISTKLFEKYIGVEEERFAEELYMNKDQISCLRRNGMHIGLHGYDHYWLGRLNYLKMKEDVNKALSVMEQFIDKDSWTLNYPYGSYNEDVINYIKSRGCKLSMTIDVGVADTSIHNQFLLPRLNTNDFPPKSSSYLSIL